MTKQSSPAGSGRERSGAWRTWLAWGSLSSRSRSGLSGAYRTYTSSPPSRMHSQLCVRRLNPGLPGGVLLLHHLQRVIRCIELCPQALNRPDLHFEGVGTDPVVITWISREHKLYSGASLISLIEHCVFFRHDRRLVPHLGFVHNWLTSRWSATKKENQFSLNGNGIMSSFLGWQFYRSTLYFGFVYVFYWLGFKFFPYRPTAFWKDITVSTSVFFKIVLSYSLHCKMFLLQGPD